MSDIPSTPEELFAHQAEPSLRQVFPAFDTLPVLQQRLLRILNVEIVAGRLSDSTLRDLTRFLLSTWRALNRSAMEHMDSAIEDAELLDDECIGVSQAMHRMDQHLVAMQGLLGVTPLDDGPDHPGPKPTIYQLSSPED